MRHLKKLKTILRSSNPFAIFIGLYLGILVSFGHLIILFILVIVVSFSIYRFGIHCSLVIVISFICGFLTKYLGRSPIDFNVDNTFIVIDAKDNYLLVQHGLNRYYVQFKNHQYQVGDILSINGFTKPLSFHRIEGQFDFANYLTCRGVQSELVPRNLNNIFLFPGRFRARQATFLSHFDEQSANYIGAILFNRRDYQTESYRQLNNMNLTHLLSSSGMLIYGHLRIVETILTRFFDERCSRRYAFLSLLPWVLFNPTAVALWRVILTGFFNMILPYKARINHEYWTKKGLVGIIMLLFSRYIVYSPGFYLSFGLAISMYMLGSTIKKNNGIKRFAWRIIPWMLLLPYLVITNGSINIVGIIMFVPLVSIHGILLSFGLLQLYVVPLPFINVPIVRLSQLLTSINNIVTLHVHFPVWTTLNVLLYLILLVLVFWVIELKMPLGRNGPLVVTLSYLVVNVLPIQNFYETSISFINVGQGDAILIKNRRTSILIDTGGSIYHDIAEMSLIPYFRRQGISALDAVIITHDDFDHSGALPSLEANFPVKQVIREKYFFPININGLIIDNLNSIDSSTDVNTASLVLKMNLLERSWLFMGDAPSIVEEAIITEYPELDIDYLKVGHHGSHTSTSRQFIEHIRPKEAIISVGRNHYGHPHPQVLDILTSYSVTIRRTDLEGTIKYNWILP